MTYKFLEKVIKKGLWRNNFECYHSDLWDLEGNVCTKLWLINLTTTYCLLCEYHYNDMNYNKPLPKKYKITEKDLFALKLLC